jgi:hypothetical protein
MELGNKKLPEHYMDRYIGYKFFKENEDHSFDIVRVLRATSDNKVILVHDNSTHPTTEDYTYLKEYTPLDPYGVMSFNIVGIYSSYDKPDRTTGRELCKDVVIMVYSKLDITLGLNLPRIICRQSVNDFFADLLYQDPSKNHMAGICCSSKTCPENFNMMQLAACDELIKANTVNFYKDDNIDTILSCVSDLDAMDNVLLKLFNAHARASANPNVKGMKNHLGWCRTVKDLLENNNFMADFNEMMDITGVDFDLSNYLDKSDTGVDKLAYPALLFLNSVHRVNAVDSRVIKFDYSIDMGKFANDNYVFWRDNTDTIYLIVYLTQGKFLEDELNEKINQLSITDKLQLSYYNKYGKNAK